MPHQTKRISMLATALKRDSRGIVMQTTSIPWPVECEEVIETTDFTRLADRAKTLATRALPALQKDSTQLKTDTLVGIRVALSMAGRGQRAPSGFKEFRGYDFDVQQLLPVQVAAE